MILIFRVGKIVTYRNISSFESLDLFRAQFGHIRGHHGSMIAVRLRGVQPTTNLRDQRLKIKDWDDNTVAMSWGVSARLKTTLKFS